MKSFFFLIALLCAFGVMGTENLLTVPLVEWKRDFRPGNRSDIYSVTAKDGTTELARTPASKFGRIYFDQKLSPGKVYRLRCERMTERGALVKMLVIFKGEDGQWREKTRLSNFEPLVNREWSEAVMTFEVPADAVETRVDFRLDSFGSVLVRNMTLVELEPAEADNWRLTQREIPFTPEKGGDYSLTPGAYFRISFEGRAISAERPGTLKLLFHTNDKGFPRDGHILFYLRDSSFVNRSEILVAADNADGVRISSDNAEIRNLKLTAVTL